MSICSLLVHTNPDKAGFVQSSLESFPGVEVHGGQNEGKLIVSLDQEGEEDSVADTMSAFRDIDGVLSTVLIYHYGGSDPLDEEITQ